MDLINVTELYKSPINFVMNFEKKKNKNYVIPPNFLINTHTHIYKVYYGFLYIYVLKPPFIMLKQLLVMWKLYPDFQNDNLSDVNSLKNSMLKMLLRVEI